MPAITHKKHHGAQVEIRVDGKRVAYASPGLPLCFLFDEEALKAICNPEDVKTYVETELKKPVPKVSFAPVVPQELLDALAAQDADEDE